ncbi:ArsR/SmtB family transcription factor [Ohtaekwangia koreensis]|uniref:DNA-binding transcriptional regulator, ArsR family n=1 Tax=Ohtaekwangia koreensis TaxID=688867 RepID=A0A1T5L8P2_9BACT|nr:metalloregulator ArsR/SmtB family transcription factor [Ohtaekwangia koreensis]SKC72351.1 DNA-binding transcriptional regulator, ArsR family [Ohtaekwangia koreensis]
MALQARRDVFQAIADPTRRDILNLISKKSLNLNTIAEQFDVSRPAISQHIKILTECGLIIIKDQGRERYCEIQVKKLAEVADWLEPFRKQWEHRFDKLDTLLVKMQSTKKHKKR